LLSNPRFSSRHIFFSLRRTHVNYLLPPFVPPCCAQGNRCFRLRARFAYLLGKQTS
jgi:hypothetical protein